MTTLGEPEVITLPELGVIGLAELMVITVPGLQHPSPRFTAGDASRLPFGAAIPAARRNPSSSVSRCQHSVLRFSPTFTGPLGSCPCDAANSSSVLNKLFSHTAGSSHVTRAAPAGNALARRDGTLGPISTVAVDDRYGVNPSVPAVEGAHQQRAHHRPTTPKVPVDGSTEGAT